MKKRLLGRAALLLVAGCATVGIAVPSAAESTITPTARDLNKNFDDDSTQWAEGSNTRDGRFTAVSELQQIVLVGDPVVPRSKPVSRTSPTPAQNAQFLLGFLF